MWVPAIHNSLPYLASTYEYLKNWSCTRPNAWSLLLNAALYIWRWDLYNFLLKYSRFKMCQSLLYSKVTPLYTYRYFLNILFHYSLPQDTEYSSLCYTVGPYCLSTLHIIVYICYSHTPSPALHPPPPPWQPQVCSLCLWVSFCFLNRFICAIF